MPGEAAAEGWNDLTAKAKIRHGNNVLMSLNENNTLLASCSLNKKYWEWSLDFFSLLNTLRGPLLSPAVVEVKFSPATIDQRRKVGLCNAVSGDCLHVVQVAKGDKEWWWYHGGNEWEIFFNFSPDGVRKSRGGSGQGEGGKLLLDAIYKIKGEMS